MRGPKSAEWRRGLAAARRYHRAHHHLDVPQTYQDPADYPLGRRLTWQRHRHTTSTLDPARTQALECLGIIWDPRQQAFDRGLAHATVYAARLGHLADPADEVHDGLSPRPLAGDPAHPRRPPHRRTCGRPHRLGPMVEPPWPIAWQRAPPRRAQKPARSRYGGCGGVGQGSACPRRSRAPRAAHSPRPTGT
ncbi:helicase associated domain-containing protein [Streptomyces sp. NBU3104]|uniref:helicase associated domain-containing protein n=1 Tax=Streptomyces sp. NBU3104 TaxID=2911367 RepID=UPI001ED9E48C|nr:helicase associated domain-containing protein [Streptomyces sp. NBU3104]UKL04224.1 helicase associated domain-containing protein [Streptomyces sp. NBU3104]